MSVALFEDDQNYLWIGLSGDEWGNNINRRPHFGRVSGGKSTFDREAENRFGTAGQPERIFFKIDRMGDQYNGFYAYVEKSIDIDQIAWKKLGTVPWIDFNGKLVLYAVNLRDKAPEVAAEFHSVRIRTQ